MRRQIIEGRGIPKHPQPFPTAVRVGNMVFSSAIGGQDAATGALPEDPASQVRNAFGHVESIMAQAGGSLADIGKIVVYLRDKKDRALINDVWTSIFPDERDRPVRHTVTADLPPNLFVQLEFIGMLANA
jgi:2-iminobutanoate/2-iminopropanoate deaminase